MKKFSLVLFWVLSSFIIQAQTPIGTDFTYQGELIFNNQLVTGSYDFEVTTFDAITAGNFYDAPYSVDAIPVINGIFNIPLNFGDETFWGNEVFLEISVRENGSGLAYESLLPRQKLTSSPYAIHAQFVGSDAVTNVEILDGTITSEDLADDSVTSSKIAASAIGAGNVNSTKIQLRVGDSCAVGSYISSINENGSVVCALDRIGLTSVTSASIVNGTIASIDMASNSITNSKIVSNAIDVTKMQDNSIGSNEIINQSITSNDIATNSITAAMIVANAVGSSEIASSAVGASEIASSAVGSDEIISSQVQRRVNSTCDQGFYLRGINEDGSVFCQRLPLGIAYVLDSEGFVGLYNSIAVGTDGLPIISYFDDTFRDLKTIKCTNSSCSNFNTPVTLDSLGVVGRYASIAIGTDDLPVISYYDSTNTDLKVVKCTSASCNSFNTPLTLDITGNIGWYTSITVGIDGMPVISYYDVTNKDLKVVKCLTVSCSSFNIPITLDSTGDLGWWTSIAIGSDGMPIISYFDATNGDLKMVKCTTVSCINFNTPLTLDSTGNVGWLPSIAIGADDLPIISYFDATNADLKVVKCTTVSCSSFNTPLTLDSTNDVGGFSSITIGVDELPIISYNDDTNGDLKIVKCTNTSCSSHNPPIILDSMGFVGRYTSIAIGTDGLPIISYYDKTNFDLKVYSCGDVDCRK